MGESTDNTNQKHPATADACRLAAIDLSSQRNEYVFEMPSRLRQAGLSLLMDERDEPALNLLCNVLCTTLPAAVLLHAFSVQSNLIGLVYFAANYGLFVQRFLLTLHYTEHRKLFKPGCSWLNHLAPYLLSPLFGVPSGAYKLHHVIMHHVEDNTWGWDLSSTEGFRRDSLACFAL
eukprot:GHRQ01021597.1.p1 GENE.GHRQ01021597.1~~GHRQ01021597.1.p1  ORF type:complete len:176 (+),score=26.66 GHRQ01021597.1:356-883(+)